MTVGVWYRVRDLDDGRRFYTQKLGFEETYVDGEGRWARLRHGQMEIGLSEGEPDEDGGVATVDVGVVFELHGEMRLLDVFDPDGNRIQFAQELGGTAGAR